MMALPYSSTSTPACFISVSLTAMLSCSRPSIWIAFLKVIVIQQYNETDYGFNVRLQGWSDQNWSALENNAKTVWLTTCTAQVSIPACCSIWLDKIHTLLHFLHPYVTPTKQQYMCWAKVQVAWLLVCVTESKYVLRTSVDMQLGDWWGRGTGWGTQ